MNLWLTILAVGLLTYLMRLSFIGLLRGRTLPPALQHALRFVPVAVLPAIIVQELVPQGSERDALLHNPRLLAGVVAALVAWYTRNVLLTIGVGMATLIVLHMVFGM